MQRVIPINDSSSLAYVCGIEDSNLKFLEEELDISILIKPEGIVLKGAKEKIESAAGIIKKISDLSKDGLALDKEELNRYFGASFSGRCEGASFKISKDFEISGIRVPSTRKKIVIPKTEGQRKYIKAIREYDIVFSTGPAGTGKTYLAMAMAVNFLMEKKVQRIILTRPAIEAGESLGFLPGTMHEKLDLYLRPLYDALYDMMEADVVENHLETGVIEIAPLAYMRGRTLNNAFVILDEAQNCTSEQLRMFLTRLGFDSKTVITGDITQSDLPEGKPAGLREAISILKAIKGIYCSRLEKQDVVRHPLIQKIIEVYENHYSKKTN